MHLHYWKCAAFAVHHILHYSDFTQAEVTQFRFGFEVKPAMGKKRETSRFLPGYDVTD